MDPLLTLLGQLGLGLATNAIYDLLGHLPRGATQQQVQQEIQNQIDLNGVSMRANTVINALAENGFIRIENSRLYANAEIVFGSVVGSASFGNNSTMSTARTSIQAGAGATMNTRGNAQVRQNPDGSISFHTGGGHIDFKTGG